jgi:hypothetical protein
LSSKSSRKDLTECETQFSRVPFDFDVRRRTSFDGCSINWTGCAAAFHLIFYWLWTNYLRRWMTPTSAHYRISTKNWAYAHRLFQCIAFARRLLRYENCRIQIRGRRKSNVCSELAAGMCKRYRSFFLLKLDCNRECARLASDAIFALFSQGILVINSY